MVEKTRFLSILGGCMVLSLLAVSGLDAAGNNLRLVQAAKNQDKEAVRSLLAERADVNAAQPDGTTALAWAAHWDDLEMADLLLQAGAGVDAANEIGVTPVSLAVVNRSSAMVEKLLQAGANPNAPLWNGETPLMTAASTGEEGILNSLLNRGADVNAKEARRGQTALMWAIAEGHPEAARLLIEHGADIRARTHRHGDFQSMLVTTFGKDIQVTPGGGYTPLLFAARIGDLETARLLVEKGADVNEGTPEEGTPLVVASAAGHERLARFLLDEGADPNAKDVNGMTPLHYAMREGLKSLNGVAIVRVKKICASGSGGRCIAAENVESVVFLDGGFAPGIKEALEEHAALAASEKPVAADTATAKSEAAPVTAGYGSAKDGILAGANMLELAKALLAHGADPNARLEESPARFRMKSNPIINLKGATPFLLAAAAKDVSAMRVLAEGRAQVTVETESDPHELYKNETGDDNQIQGNGTPLLVAAGLGRKDDMGREEARLSLEAVRTLVEMGADVNQVNDTGWTALHAAAFMGANPVVEYLMSRGASINVRNGCGQTPLSLAAGTDSKGLLQRAIPHPSTAELLRNSGAVADPASERVGACVLGRFGLEYAAVKEEGE